MSEAKDSFSMTATRSAQAVADHHVPIALPRQPSTISSETENTGTLHSPEFLRVTTAGKFEESHGRDL